MNEAVTDIIVARSRETDRLSTMLMWSIAAHVVVTSAVWLMPEPAVEAPPPVMMISLGGAPGPRTGGMNQAGARAVQAPEPEQPIRRAEAPPAPKPPPMAVPEPKAKPAPKPETAPREARGRTVTTGEKPQEGREVAEKQIRGQGFGISTAGGSGSGVRLDVTNFCCQEYIDLMAATIRARWREDAVLVGVTTIKFTIQKDGTLTDIQLEKSSGYAQLNLYAERAVRDTRTLPPLPRAYPNPTLTVHLDFEDE
jgi:protein TonB